MKRILFTLSFIFVVLEGHSQIITNINIQGIDCNNTTGYAAVSTDIPAAWFIFKQYDNSTMSYVTIYSGTQDSVGLSSCGNVSVEVYNSSSPLPLLSEPVPIIDFPIPLVPPVIKIFLFIVLDHLIIYTQYAKFNLLGIYNKFKDRL